jgi:hypothetical protein
MKIEIIKDTDVLGEELFKILVDDSHVKWVQTFQEAEEVVELIKSNISKGYPKKETIKTIEL